MRHLKSMLCMLTSIAASAASGGQLLAEVAVVTAPSSPISTVKPEELEKLFLAKAKTIGSNHAVPAEQKNKSVKSEFHEKITQKSPDVLQRYWARKVFAGDSIPPIELANDQDVKTWVNSTPGGVGYIDAKSVDATVKVIFKTH